MTVTVPAAQRFSMAGEQGFLKGQRGHGSPLPGPSADHSQLGPCSHLECLEQWQALVSKRGRSIPTAHVPAQPNQCLACCSQDRSKYVMVTLFWSSLKHDVQGFKKEAAGHPGPSTDCPAGM